ncbi:hypothetical protein IQ07DRAFT_589665 [Pyrenochaeta sp. DS3sAY3a]|nr:hypothetical protein IQ07DRAFT_589665 [Pyrenochaeta sp. DS3sAY3a]
MLIAPYLTAVFCFSKATEPRPSQCSSRSVPIAGISFWLSDHPQDSAAKSCRCVRTLKTFDWLQASGPAPNEEAPLDDC